MVTVKFYEINFNVIFFKVSKMIALGYLKIKNTLNTSITKKRESTSSNKHRSLEMKPSISMNNRQGWPNVQLRLLRAFPEPEIEGPSTLVKTITLPKIEDKVVPYVLGTKIARPSHLV